MQKPINFKKTHFLLFVILFLASVLRLYSLSSNPPSLNWDEVSHGYNAYSLLNTGKDEWGVALPTIFRAFGDYKLPVYVYSVALSVGTFGLNAFAARFPSALAGISTVFFTYLLVLELFKNKFGTFGNKHLAIFSALFVSIQPWSLFLSRGAFEANLSLTLIVAATYFFLKGLVNPQRFIYSAFLFGLSVWTYNSARVFVPMFLLFLLLLYINRFKKLVKTRKSELALALLMLFIFLRPMFVQLTDQVGQARYSKVAILDEGAIARINEYRVSSDLSPFFSRAVYNKITYFSLEFTKNWSSHYSGDFLYIYGGDNYQFSLPGHGVLYPINIIFLIIGVVYLIKSRKKESYLVLFWFFSGSVASSLTSEAPHTLRAITMLPSPMIISAVGLLTLYKWLKKKYEIVLGNKKKAHRLMKINALIYFGLLSFFVLRYLSLYFNDYPEVFSQSWQYGYEQIVEYAKEHYNEYDKIIINKKYGEPHEFFLFFWPWGPAKYQNDPDLIRFEQTDWFWVDRFDKFYFVNDWQINEAGTESNQFYLESGGLVDCAPVGISGDQLKLIEVSSTDKCLLITSFFNVPQGWKKLETVYFLDGFPAFEIYEN